MFHAKRLFSGDYAEIWAVREVSGYIFRVYRHDKAEGVHDFENKDDALKCAQRKKMNRR
jgi:hypothetical protein